MCVWCVWGGAVWFVRVCVCVWRGFARRVCVWGGAVVCGVCKPFVCGVLEEEGKGLALQIVRVTS